ncbi:MAG: hypothetical protein ACTHM2_03295 [Afipia sp.]
MNISPNAESLANVVRLGEVQRPANSPLVNYALSGLQRCWMPEHGRWSHIYHLDGRAQPNQSIPHSDVFYTLNVLLGLSRLKVIPDSIDVPEIFARNVSQLTMLPVAKYAYGMALWSSAELHLDIPGFVVSRIEELLSDQGSWRHLRAQDLGMLLTGAVAQVRAGEKRWLAYAHMLFVALTERFHSKSGLFYNAATGLRRRFSSFASQTYLTLACYHYAELTGNLHALSMAKECTRRLIELQGPQGEWPWFYDAPQGRVIDFYEVYSVHQYGMAPAFLECAERHDVRGARDALVTGFKWVLGQNQLHKSMLVPGLQMSFRSQIREGELHTNKRRAFRAMANAIARRDQRLIDPARIGLRLECRSYELGWILWSFGRRSDLIELTHDNAFVDATRETSVAS